MTPLVTAADVARFSYWVVVAGSGMIGAIMAYLLLPSRLKVLGRPTVLFRSERASRDTSPLGTSPGSPGGAGSTERAADPSREARERSAEASPVRFPVQPRDRVDRGGDGS